MNEIINELLLAGDKFMLEIYLRVNLPIVFADQLLNSNKEYKNSKKQEIQDT